MFLIGVTNPVTLVVVFPVLGIFVYCRNYFMKSSREIKRIEGISKKLDKLFVYLRFCDLYFRLLLTVTGRSPLFGHFSTTLLGLDTIRSFGAQETFKDQFISYQDSHSRAWFSYISGQAWLTFRLQILCVFFLTFVAVISPVLKDGEFMHHNVKLLLTIVYA